jgi:peptide chain release factor 2
MYLRWAERRGFKAEMIEHQPGEGAGIKGATITLEGPYAYGYAKAEGGVHRLVRISPFDANARRQTSFASVLIVPDIEDEIETTSATTISASTPGRSSAGGQHVNRPTRRALDAPAEWLLPSPARTSAVSTRTRRWR